MKIVYKYSISRKKKRNSVKEYFLKQKNINVDPRIHVPNGKLYLLFISELQRAKREIRCSFAEYMYCVYVNIVQSALLP